MVVHVTWTRATVRLRKKTEFKLKSTLCEIKISELNEF